MCCPTLIPASISFNSTSATDLVSLSNIFDLLGEASEELQEERTRVESGPIMSIEPIPLGRSIVSSDDIKSAAYSSSKRKPRPGKHNYSSHHGREHHEHGVVQHSYHDYSLVAPEAKDFYVLPSQESRSGSNIAFPVILHRLLESAVDEGFEEVISWQPHGRAFLVHDHERFVKEVMPNYFRQTRFSSFQRQLSLYGFLRLTHKGPDSGAYYNEHFLRGLPHLCTQMHRTRVKGYGVRQSSSPETEPDFYSMKAVNPPSQERIVEAPPSNLFSISNMPFKQTSTQSLDPFSPENLEPIPATINNTFEEQEAMADFLSDVDLDDNCSFSMRRSYEGEDNFARIYNHIMHVQHAV